MTDFETEVRERLARLEENYKAVNEELGDLKTSMDEVLKEQSKLIRWVVVSLLIIVAAVVGVELAPW